MSVQVSDFKYIPGENDALYIKLLQEHINRQDAIIHKAIAKLRNSSCPHYIRNKHDRGNDSICRKFQCEVSALPRKTGKWTIEDCHAATYKYCCSACGAHHRARYDFCPSCGADMRGKDDEL